MRGGYEPLEPFTNLVFPFVNTEACGREKSTEESGHVVISRKIGGGLRWFIYIPVVAVG